MKTNTKVNVERTDTVLKCCNVFFFYICDCKKDTRNYANQVSHNFLTQQMQMLRVTRSYTRVIPIATFKSTHFRFYDSFSRLRIETTKRSLLLKSEIFQKSEHLLMRLSLSLSRSFFLKRFFLCVRSSLPFLFDPRRRRSMGTNELFF